MSWGRGKTEKGQGGKLGHSNRDGWGYHDEEKESSRKQRRLEQKQLILNETSVLDDSLRERVRTLVQLLDDLKLKLEFYEFDSGAYIIDFWIQSACYCIQTTEEKFGWSKIGDDVDFTSIPDSGYMNWIEFKKEFDELIEFSVK